jgi:hypothetical protein
MHLLCWRSTLWPGRLLVERQTAESEELRLECGGTSGKGGGRPAWGVDGAALGVGDVPGSQDAP